MAFVECELIVAEKDIWAIVGMKNICTENTVCVHDNKLMQILIVWVFIAMYQHGLFLNIGLMFSFSYSSSCSLSPSSTKAFPPPNQESNNNSHVSMEHNYKKCFLGLPRSGNPITAISMFPAISVI